MLGRPIRYSWYVALTATLASWTWRKWPDIAIDFGHELYDPWRLSQGAVLYRDVASLYGPFSQYFNSVLFRIFGVSFTTIIVANLALVLLLVWLVDTFFDSVAGPVAAFACGTMLLTVFAFGQYMNIGNYNFISPYAHEATHALIAAVGMVVLLSRWANRPERWTPIAAGLCFGIVLLTKPETAVASAFAASVAFFLAWRMRRAVAMPIALFAASAAIPVVIAFALFARALPVGDALRAALGAFTSLHAAATSTVFYLRVMGLDDPLRNLGISVAATAAVLLFMFVSGRCDQKRGLDLAWRVALLVGLGAVLIATPANLARSLMLAMVVIFVLHAWPEPNFRRFSFAVWAAFALAMLGRIALKSQVAHFGFILALPAMLLLAGALIGRGGGLPRALNLALLAAFAIAQLRLTALSDDPKDYALGPSGDQIMVVSPEQSSKSAAFATALERINALIPPTGTLAALPQGAMLNYWSRRINPTPYINIMPTELAAFGEDAMLAAYQRTPPDLFLLVHSDPSEFDLRPFGQDAHYGARIMAWVRSQYELEETILADPASYERFGIQIFTRKR